eukprot:6683580-Karenia_brevis.AAC.1
MARRDRSHGKLFKHIRMHTESDSTHDCAANGAAQMLVRQVTQLIRMHWGPLSQIIFSNAPRMARRKCLYGKVFEVIRMHCGLLNQITPHNCAAHGT